MHKRLTNLEYLGTTQVERSIRCGHRIALGFVGYMGDNPVFKHIPARLDGKGNYFTEYIKKIKMGIPFTRVTARLTEVRADAKAARLASAYIELCGVK